MKTTIYILLLAMLYNLPIATAKKDDLSFTENKGQITDQYNTPRADIDYKLEANGVTLFVGDGQLHYQWTRSQKEELKNNKEESNTATDIVDNISIYRMDVTLVGANKHALAVAEDIAPWTDNYYLPQCGDGVTAKSYRKISYKNVYPNIDWVLYIQHGQVKYDFVIHPGGQLADIKLRYDGATTLTIDNGALKASTPYGNLTEAAPISYIAGSGANIPSQYLLKGNELQYSLSTTQTNDETIVIDPGLLWCTYYGSTASNGSDVGNDVVTDHIGGVYMVGNTNTLVNIATTGAFQTSYSGGTIDGYVVKFDDSGVRQWGTYYGGAGYDYLLSAAVDNNGSVYAVGHTDSSSGMATSGAHQTSFAGTLTTIHLGGDIILIKLNTTNGQRQWSTYYGGTGEEHHADIDCDDSGNVYITGWSNSPSGIATTGSYQDTVNTINGFHNSFIAKFTSGGVRIWGTYFSDNNGNIQMRNIACDHNNNIYISGRANGMNNGAATTGAYQTSITATNNLMWDGILAKFSGNGNRLWTTFIGDISNEYVLDNVCDKSGNVYITGNTGGPINAPSNLVSATGYDTSHNGADDIFLMKFSPTGTMLWGTFYGGASNDEGHTVAISTNGNLYAGGATYSSSGIATTNGYQNILIGNSNLYLASFDTATGYPKWATYYGKGTEGGSTLSQERDMGLATSPKGIVFLSSFTTSSGLATANAHQQGFSGNRAALLPAFYIDTVAYIQEPYTDTIWCPGDTLRIAYGVNNAFAGANIFSIDLSDANGNFANAVTIGTHTDTIGDTIVCIVPLNTSSGTGYRIRIRSSAPAYSFQELAVNIKINNTVTGFSAGSNTPICSGDSLKLDGTSTSTDVTWAWTGVGSFSSSAEDTFILNPTVAMSGDYILTATLNSTGCSLRDTVTVQVKPTPNKPTTSSNAPLCAGGSLNLTSSSTSTGISYSWAGPGGYTSSSQNPTINNISAAASGDYISTVTMNGCTNKDTITVVINPIPNKPTAGSNSPLCAGQVLNLTASTVSNATYTWWGPAAYSATVQNPTRSNITTSHAGMYYVFATVNGCNSDTDSVAVQVNPDPQVNVVATPGSNICAGQSATFVAFTSNAGATPTFKWMLNGVATGNTTTSYINNSLQTGDVVYCIMDATGNCSGSYTDTSNITTMLVSPVVAPTVTINANPALPVAPWTLVTFTATPINGGASPTYQWKRNGQDVVGATNDTWGTYQLSDGDVVSVVLYSTYQCADPDSAVSNAINIQLNLGVDDLTAGSLQLYPNPNNGSFTLKGNVPNNKPIDLTIINKLGQLVYHTIIQPQNNAINQQININKELATGIYLLQLKTENAHSNVKLQIQ